MTLEDGSVGWFSPDPRAIIPVDGFHISRTLAKTIARGTYEVRFDTSYDTVMRACLRPDDNWISETFIEVYTRLHEIGFGHCAEAWQDDELVGGVYGFAAGSFFSAESMFHCRTDASKVALHALIERCRQLGITLFDTQYISSHLASLGGIEITRAEYLVRLGEALRAEPVWSPRLPEAMLQFLPGR